MKLFVNCLNSALFLLITLSALTADVSSYKFLGVLPTAARSHHIIGSALFKELARKGHDVTVISPFPLKKPMANYHDVDAPGPIKVMEKDIANALNLVENSVVFNVAHFYDMGLAITESVLQEPSVQALMKSNATFDAVICEVFLSETLFGLSEHFNAPLIGLSTFGAHVWNTDMIGSPSPPSYVPNPLLSFTDHMTLLQRLANLAFASFERLLLNLYYLPRQAALYERYFPDNKHSMYEVRKNASLVLLNQHVSLTSPRPYMPNHVEVGGMHINRKRTPLPAAMQQFIEDSPHGVIYFSMGSNLKSKNFPAEKRAVILNTFRGLKQRVLWKFEEPNLEHKPDNVFISDWFPQDDILAHPNVRLFITHGGLLSTTESIYHGKPFIGLPIFGDQFLNMARAEAYGYGIKLDYTQLNETDFSVAIQRVLGSPSYTTLVKSMSQRYRDQPMEPMALATFWVEHVARTKGASYLHCAGLDLSFIEYHNIDVLLIVFGVVSTLLIIFIWVIRLVWRLLQHVCVKKEKKQKRH